MEVVSIGEPHQKYAFFKRAGQERRYGRRLLRYVLDTRPEIVLSCNTPLLTADILQRGCRSSGIKYLHWAQDLHALAIRALLARRLPLVGGLIGWFFERLEKRIIELADGCAVISEEFVSELERMGIKPRSLVVVPNWMPLDEMVPMPKDNAWSRRHGLADTLNLMYVGTLSLKHDAGPFVELAEYFRADPRVRVVVVSAGIVFDTLIEERRRRGLENLVLLGWQKYEELSLVFGAADVLFATVSADGSRFSIPCKVLSYASAGRPVLAHMPRENLVRRIVEGNGFGLAVDLNDSAGLRVAAERLLLDRRFQQQCQGRARAYAESDFVVTDKADAFYRLAQIPVPVRGSAG
jgi:glycosyltransferase involved in cell wall biosynthesis